MWDLIVSVPDHRLSFYLLSMNIPHPPNFIQEENIKPCLISKKSTQTDCNQNCMTTRIR